MVAFLLPMVAKAQLGSLVEYPVGGDNGNIVRIWQGKEKILSYGGIAINQHIAGTLCLSDYSQFFSTTPSTPVLSIKSADLTAAAWNTVNPWFTTIQDICIVDDIAFVCGSAMDTNFPQSHLNAIGWFDLNGFSSGNIILHYIQLPFVWYWKKIVAYPYNHGYTVLALGEGNNNFDYIFEIQDVTALTMLTVQIGQYPANTYWDKEAADGIIVTADEVFVVGNLRIPPSDRQLCIRKGDRNGVLADPQFNQWRYDYPSSAYEVNANTYSTLIEDNIIATAYVHADNSTSFLTRLRMINTSTMDMINSQEFMIDDKWEPEEIIYLNAPKKIVLLQEFYDNWNFVVLDPFYNSDYLADYMTYPDVKFHAMDGDHYDMFVSTGDNNWLYFQRLIMPLTLSAGCTKNLDLEVHQTDNVLKNQNNVSIQTIGPYFPEIQISIPVQSLQSTTICSFPLNMK